MFFHAFSQGAAFAPGKSLATDRHGGLPVTEAYTPADLAATIFDRMGIHSDTEFHDLGRSG
jgi:hypothetical protein